MITSGSAVRRRAHREALNRIERYRDALAGKDRQLNHVILLMADAMGY